jgi:hypothetical protein
MANAAIVQLYQFWKKKNILIRTKIQLFTTTVNSVLLYGHKTWKITDQISNSFQLFVNQCLQRTLNIKWLDKISNEELRHRMKQTSIEQEINERKWC